LGWRIRNLKLLSVYIIQEERRLKKSKTKVNYRKKKKRFDGGLKTNCSWKAADLGGLE
jgi:hypothetical protein